MENHLLQKLQGRARGLYCRGILNILNLQQNPAEGFGRVHFNPSPKTKIKKDQTPKSSLRRRHRTDQAINALAPSSTWALSSPSLTCSLLVFVVSPPAGRPCLP